MNDAPIVPPPGVTVAQALALHRLGLCVIPVPLPRPGVPKGQPGDGKTPALAWIQFQKRRPTEDEIAAWFSQPQNAGIVCGAVSGLVVLDADGPEALRYLTRRAPWTPWQVATSRGFHLYFLHPGGRVGNGAGLVTPASKIPIDRRADGGFVIAPGSTHASGCRYEFAGDWTQPRESVPVFSSAWLDVPRPRPEPVARPRFNTSTPKHARARAYVAKLPRPRIGQGSDAATLYAACRLVRGFALDEAEAVDLLDAQFGGRPGWDRRWIEAKVRSALRYGTEPIGGLL